jgi:hypothetical protein
MPGAFRQESNATPIDRVTSHRVKAWTHGETRSMLRLTSVRVCLGQNENARRLFELRLATNLSSLRAGHFARKSNTRFFRSVTFSPDVSLVVLNAQMTAVDVAGLK